MKYILVTGCAGGIGFHTTKKLIDDESNFVFGVDIQNCEIKHNNFKFIKADITKNDSFELIKKEILKYTSSLYAIVNVAGIFLIQSMIEGSEEDLRKIIEINFFSVYKLNRCLFSLLSKDSRIIIFSSEVGRYSPQPFNGYYALSKILVDKYADILRREFNYLNIKVIKVQSGAIRTKLLEHVDQQYKEMVDSSKLYKKPLTKLKYLMDGEINKQVDPELCANYLIKIIDKKHPHICYKYKNSLRLRFLSALPERLQDFIYKKVIK